MSKGTIQKAYSDFESQVRSLLEKHEFTGTNPNWEKFYTRIGTSLDEIAKVQQRLENPSPARYIATWKKIINNAVDILSEIGKEIPPNATIAVDAAFTRFEKEANKINVRKKEAAWISLEQMERKLGGLEVKKPQPGETRAHRR